MNKETGGPAFPQSGGFSNEGSPFDSKDMGGAGLTMRDYFAAKAMESVPLALDDGEQALIASAAYRQADAMIRARGQ